MKIIVFLLVTIFLYSCNSENEVVESANSNILLTLATINYLKKNKVEEAIQINNQELIANLIKLKLLYEKKKIDVQDKSTMRILRAVSKYLSENSINNPFTVDHDLYKHWENDYEAIQNFLKNIEKYCELNNTENCDE